MNVVEIGLVLSIVIAVYYFQQIKIILKNHGYDIEYFTGWVGDYKRFKGLIAAEEDEETKRKYGSILWGLHFSGILLVVVVILAISKYS